MNEDEQPILTNTGDHERAISDGAKGIAAGAIDLVATALNACIEKVGSDDPLSAERYIHLADLLSQIAERLYNVGELARGNAETFYRSGDSLRKLEERKHG
jgi:hypothetical protein